LTVENAYVVAIEPTSPIQRDQVQGFIKKEAEDWWHGIADLWIVTGKSAAEWRDALKIFFPQGSGSLLVLKIDTNSSGTWALTSSIFSASQRKWIRENL